MPDFDDVYKCDEYKFDTSSYVTLPDIRPLTYLCDTKSHLICIPYSIENLHRMAVQLGIKRCWYHAGSKPHYDIPKTRYDEIRAKCVLVSQREILRLMVPK